MAATGVGGRVAEERKLAGLTQQQLATRANVSTSLIRAVEQGTRPASPAFVSAVSRALSVGVPDLLGQPYPRENYADHRLFATVPGLRREMAAYRLPPDESVRPRSLPELTTAVAEASRLRHDVNLASLGSRLPALLEELRAAVWMLDGDGRQRAYGLLAETYYAVDQVLSKLGHVDLASLAVDRYEWAAERSGDPLAVLVGHYRRAGELISAGDWDSAARFLESSRCSIEDQLGGADPVTLSVWGNLHLKSGLAAARAGRRQECYAHLDEARETARRIGTDRDDYRLFFGPTNVEIWSVGLAVEMCDGTEAVKRAEGVHFPAGTPRERVGHHHIDTARAWLLHGNRERALASLVTARHTAPQQTRYHPMVHETVRVLARQDRRRTDTVHGFAAWCGIS
jgi:transcriptional regulator with XRE-family HTH domain